jgi:hypothetical protein
MDAVKKGACVDVAEKDRDFERYPAKNGIKI